MRGTNYITSKLIPIAGLAKPIEAGYEGHPYNHKCSLKPG